MSRRSSTTTAPEPAQCTRAVTWRSVLACCLLLPINAYWIVQMEAVRYSAHPTTISLFFNLIFILICVTLVNRAIQRRLPRVAMQRGEILFVYAVLAIGSCLSGHDMFQVLVPTLAWPYQYADGSNNWKSLFMDPYLPKWAFVTDKHILRGFFAGNDTLYRMDYLRAWLPVALFWSAFTGVMLFVMLCANAILRRQWTENERLTYPIVQLPLQITNDQSFTPKIGLFRNRLFWLGFVLAAGVDTINSLNVYYPSIPTILTPGRGISYYNLNDWVTQKPWNAIGWTPISFYPFLIGLGMLMPMDFLFSAWFFYLFWKAQLVLAVAMAWDQDPQFPYTNMQAFGAYMAFCFTSVWLSRDYLRQVGRRILGRPDAIDDSAEPLSYRSSAVGIVAGIALLCWMTTALGMGPWLPIVVFIIYFALALAITRMRAEMGTPVHDLHFTGPDTILVDAFGPRSFSGGQLTVFSLFWWFNRAYRSHPMPHQLESFKLAEQARSEYRSWFWALAVFGIISGLVAFWAILHLMYDYGARAKSVSGFGPEAYARLEGWLRTPRIGTPEPAIAIGVGLLTAIALQLMRVRFAWWPFHPLGYAVTASWEINLVWVPLAIAWMVKVAILRYGGRIAFQKSVPFFLGLIIGQFVVGSLWNIYGIAMGVPTYQFWQ
ncbi:MAG: hypothetical protein HUU17_12970 [Chthonomonadales bacterium]|nr:hypothetical protein [Chthonomonadales bacterium]